MGRLGRAWTLYQAMAFVVLIPVVSYKVVALGLPKKILLFVIPAYALLAWSFYSLQHLQNWLQSKVAR
jgi:hypothetical protein